MDPKDTQPEESALLKFRKRQAAGGGSNKVSPRPVPEEKKEVPQIVEKAKDMSKISVQPLEEMKQSDQTRIDRRGRSERSNSRSRSPRAKSLKQDKQGIAKIREELERQFPQGLGYQLAPYESDLAMETHLDVFNLIATTKEAKEKAQYFCCSICSMIVVDPVECADCNTAYCRTCLIPWAERGGSCPKRCKRDQPVKVVEMHRYAKQDLKAMEFRCRTEHCQHKATYEKALRHLSECTEKFVCCANGCGVGILAKHQRYHDYLQCPKFQLKCPTCDYNLGFINGENADYEEKPHDCVTHLKQRIHNLELGIAPGGQCDEHVRGYNLALNFCDQCDGTLRKYVHCPPGYGSARCDRCKCTPLNHAAFFFHCVECKFDLCFHCSLATQGKLPITSMSTTINSLNKTFIMVNQSPKHDFSQNGHVECCRGNQCVSQQNQGHITDHFWYENEQDEEDIICVYCLLALYAA